MELHIVMAVIKRQKLGIFPGYFQLLSTESRRKIEPKGTPSCLTPPPLPPLIWSTWQLLILVTTLHTLHTYNPGQNYLRKFSPSCSLSYATKLFPKGGLCIKKTPSPNSMLLATNALGSGFHLNTQQHCLQGKGEREELVQLRCLEKCSPNMHFSQQFCPRLSPKYYSQLYSRQVIHRTSTDSTPWIAFTASV